MWQFNAFSSCGHVRPRTPHLPDRRYVNLIIEPEIIGPGNQKCLLYRQGYTPWSQSQKAVRNEDTVYLKMKLKQSILFMCPVQRNLTFIVLDSFFYFKNE